MGTAERRERERQQRRNLIIDAAEKVFFSKGLDEAKMDEIARTAELSKGLLYFYFNSKEELFEAVCDRGATVLETMFQHALDSNETGSSQLSAIGYAYFKFAHEYQDYFDSMLTIHAKLIAQTVGSPDQKRVLELVAKAVENGIEDGSLRDDLDPFPTAMVLWGQTHGLVMVSRMHSEVADFEDLASLAYSFISRALAPDPS